MVGESGTLRDCDAGLEQAPAVGGGADGQNLLSRTVWAKTGTLNDVSALAGVTVARDGDVLTFSLIANREDLFLGSCNDLQQGLIRAVFGHPYGPSSADAALHPAPATRPVVAPAAEDADGE